MHKESKENDMLWTMEQNRLANYYSIAPYADGKKVKEPKDLYKLANEIQRSNKPFELHKSNDDLKALFSLLNSPN